MKLLATTQVRKKVLFMEISSLVYFSRNPNPYNIASDYG